MVIVAKSGWPVAGHTHVNSFDSSVIVYGRPGCMFGNVSNLRIGFAASRFNSVKSFSKSFFSIPSQLPHTILLTEFGNSHMWRLECRLQPSTRTWNGLKSVSKSNTSTPSARFRRPTTTYVSGVATISYTLLNSHCTTIVLSNAWGGGVPCTAGGSALVRRRAGGGRQWVRDGDGDDGDQVARESDPYHLPRAGVAVYFGQHVADDIRNGKDDDGRRQDQSADVDQLDGDNVRRDQARHEDSRDPVEVPIMHHDVAQ